VSGAGAFAYSQAVTIATQLLSLPLFLRYWNTEQYGEWLMLSAIPVYLGMADFGIVAVAGNKMTMHVARKEIQDANRIFQSALAFATISALIVGGICMAAVLITDTAILATPDRKLALCLLLIAMQVAMFSSAIDIVFRANRLFARGTYLINTARLAEMAFAVMAVAMAGSLLAAAIGFLVGRVAFTAIMYADARRCFPKFHWGFANAERRDIREMMKPAIAFLAFPAGNAIAFQGITLIIGSCLGPAAVTLYNTYRTLSRVLVQAASLIARPLWPEISAQFALGNMSKIRAALAIGTGATAMLMITCGAALLYFAPAILEAWTHAKVAYDADLFSLFLIAAGISGLWQVAMVALGATNRHAQFATAYLALSVLVATVTYAYAPQFGIRATISPQIAVEVVLVLIALLFARRLYWQGSLVARRGTNLRNSP
jgi:O-antigen/teichoic acid export membrane protein